MLKAALNTIKQNKQTCTFTPVISHYLMYVYPSYLPLSHVLMYVYPSYLPLSHPQLSPIITSSVGLDFI